MSKDRDIVIAIDACGICAWHYNTVEMDDIFAEHKDRLWPLVTVDEESEAETLLALFCELQYSDIPGDDYCHYALLGFKGTVDDLPYAKNRFIDGFDQLRGNYQ